MRSTEEIERPLRVRTDAGRSRPGPVSGDGERVVRSPVNAHDHGYGVRPLDFGLIDDALELWVPGLRQRPRTDPYLEALVAFARLALNGVGATMHCHNSLNVDTLAGEATAVVRAAGDVGIRLALSCPLLDHDAWAYDGGPERLRLFMHGDEWNELSPLAPRYAGYAEQIAAVDAIARDHSGGMVDVQYGPIGPQWCSDAMLEAVADASAATGRRIHMHLLESRRQREWLDRRFAGGVLAHLDRIGFLSPRLAIAHGVHLCGDEIALLAERGVQLVSNPSANLRLRSGTAPVAEAHQRGMRIAIGLDGTGLDDDQDLWREMRLLYLLHGGTGLERDLPLDAVFEAATGGGRFVVGGERDEAWTVVDEAALTQDRVVNENDERQTLIARMSGAYVKGLEVAGRWIVKDRTLRTIDFAAARRALGDAARFDADRMREDRRRAAIIAAAARRYYASRN